MKLIAAIVDDKDVDKVMTALTGQHVGVTCISSTGSLITPGNSTLLIGLDEESVPQAMSVIADLAASRPSYVPYTYAGNLPATSFAEVQVGGFLSFVLDIVHFEQV
ncbi:MAG: cyclic-di-AMP receptor [Anaerolineae bacterium]|nr:cyclic-di-AMP receptor [Anaerolineae bacterium]